MELKNYAFYIVVNLIFFNINCWASNLVAFERLSYNELASECLGEEYVHIVNTIIALAINDCHNNSTLRYEITDQAANADEESTDLDGHTVLTIIKKNGKDRDERRMMNGGGEGGGEEEGAAGGEPDYGYGGGEEEEPGGEPDYGYGGDEGEDGGETDYDYGGGEGEEGGGETDYGYGGGETDYGDVGGEDETGYEDYNGGGSENGDDGSTYESYGKQNRKPFATNSRKSKNNNRINSNKKGFRSSSNSNNNNNNRNSRKGFRNNNNNNNQKGFRKQKGRSNINRSNKGFNDYDNFGSFNNNNNQEYDYRKNRYNARTNIDSRARQNQKYSGNNRDRGTIRGRSKDLQAQGRSDLGQNMQPNNDNQGYTNNDPVDDYSDDYDYQSRGERKDERDFDEGIGAAFGFEIGDGYSRKKRKSSYRPDLTSISDLIIREIAIEDKFLTFECVLQRRLEITEESDVSNILATTFKLNEKAIKDFEESWNKCLDYVECVMEMFPHSTVFPRRMRRILELGKCIQRQIRLNCIKNDIRNVLPSTSQTNGTLTEIFDDLVTKLLEIVAFNGDMESFDLLLI